MVLKILCASSEIVTVGKSADTFKLSCDVNLVAQAIRDLMSSTFEKRFARSVHVCRTVNRHRWEGREYQGERVTMAQGTRQNSWA